MKKEMICKEIFRVLSEYLDSELDMTPCEKLEHHLQTCEPCEAFLHTLRKTLEICRSYQPDTKSEIQIDSEVKEQLRTAYKKFIQQVAQT